MRKILVPVDGSPSADHAIKHVIATSKTGPDVEVHLLHVQPLLDVGKIAAVDKPGLVERLSLDEANEKLSSAERLLGGVAIRHSTHVVTGDAAREIALFADVRGCTEIIMGTRGMGTIAGLLLGSVAMKVLHLAKIPVTLVK